MHKKYFLWKRIGETVTEMSVSKENDLDMGTTAPPNGDYNHLPVRAYPGYCPRKDDRSLFVDKLRSNFASCILMSRNMGDRITATATVKGPTLLRTRFPMLCSLWIYDSLIYI